MLRLERILMHVGIFQSQRDCVLQPKVAESARLPWGNRSEMNSTATRLWRFRVWFGVLVTWATTPLGL
jgi:hypothetical protein